MFSGLIFAALVFATASSGAVFKPGQWYEGLAKPSWTPKPIVFPLVWTVLYILIGWSGWLVWQTEGMGAAMIFWGIQLIANAAWSWLFFGLRRMDLAFYDIGVMILSIIGYIVFAAQVSTLAAWMFAPYALWAFIAALLNLRVWQLNPQAA